MKSTPRSMPMTFAEADGVRPARSQEHPAARSVAPRPRVMLEKVRRRHRQTRPLSISFSACRPFPSVSLLREAVCCVRVRRKSTKASCLVRPNAQMFAGDWFVRMYQLLNPRFCVGVNKYYMIVGGQPSWAVLGERLRFSLALRRTDALPLHPGPLGGLRSDLHPMLIPPLFARARMLVAYLCVDKDVMPVH